MRLVLLSVALLVLIEGTARSQHAPIPAGFRPHVQAKLGGRIDWARGEILAEGMGRAKGDREQDRKMAERAAEIVAARNAVLLSMGVFIDRNGMLADVRDGVIHLEAILSGHEKFEVEWDDSVLPPVCRVRMRVPLWGVRSMASIDFDRQYKQSRGTPRMPLAPPRIGDLEPDEVLLIDARGTGLRPCLYPTVFNHDGRVFYNFAVRAQVHRDIRPAVYYIEPDPDVKRAATDGEVDAKHESETADNLNEIPKSPSQIRVRALKAGGTHSTDIVIRQNDCQRLAESSQVSRLLQHGRVLVVVDPVDPPPPDDSDDR